MKLSIKPCVTVFCLFPSPLFYWALHWSQVLWP